MLCRLGRYLSFDPAQTFRDKLAKGPASAIAGKHGKIMDVDFTASVRLRDLVGINIIEPVICRYGAAIVQYEAAKRIAYVGVFVDTPVRLLEIAVHGVDDVEQNVFGASRPSSLLAVQDKGLRDTRMTALDERFFNDILDLFHSRNGIGMKFEANRLFSLFCKGKRKFEVLAANRFRSLENRICDFVIVVRNKFPIAFSDR